MSVQHKQLEVSVILWERVVAQINDYIEQNLGYGFVKQVTHGDRGSGLPAKLST